VIRGSYDDALYKLTYTLLYFTTPESCSLQSSTKVPYLASIQRRLGSIPANLFKIALHL